MRIKCPARFKPSCNAVATAVTRRKKGKPMTRAVRVKVRSTRWKRVALLVKPKFRAKIRSLSKVKRKTIHVRIKIKSKRGKKKGTVYHRLRVRTS